MSELKRGPKGRFAKKDDDQIAELNELVTAWQEDANRLDIENDDLREKLEIAKSNSISGWWLVALIAGCVFGGVVGGMLIPKPLPEGKPVLFRGVDPVQSGVNYPGPSRYATEYAVFGEARKTSSGVTINNLQFFPKRPDGSYFSPGGDELMQASPEIKLGEPQTCPCGCGKKDCKCAADCKGECE